MATNYTTKTASLRATRADMRQVAVNKKIEIGTVAKDENGLPTSGTAVDSTFVSTDKLYVTDTREGSDTQGKRTDVMDILDTMKNGIDIGTDTSEAPEDDPESGVTNAPAAYVGVSKLNFRGEYVTVVEDPVTHEITLWLNKSTAYPEYKACPRTSGTDIDSTSNVTTYTHDTDTFGITAGGQKTAYLVSDGSNFGSSTWTFKSAANTAANTTDGLVFRVSSSQALFVRTVYEGTASAWQKVDFATKAGRTYAIATGYSTSKSTPFSGSSYKTSSVNGITLKYSVHPLTSADAPSGRVPGTSECEMSLAVNWDTILTKDGGTASLQIAFDKNDKSAPADANIVNLVNGRFFSEKKGATCAVPVISYNTKAVGATKVSGLSYLGSGTKVNVSVASIADTQWKTSNTTGNRATIQAAGGTAKTFTKSQATSSTTGEFRINDTTKANHSDAVYSIHDVVLTTGNESTSDRGLCRVTCTPISTANGTAQSATLNAYWNNIPTSTAQVENFGFEKTANGGYRMLTETSEVGSYDNTALVTSLSATVNGIETVPAVCQYGTLKHPANAAVSITGADNSESNPYADVTKPASFIRKFTADAARNKFSLSGTNLVQSNVSIYWYDDKPTNKKWRPLVVDGKAASDNQTTISGNTITRTINTGAQEDKQAYQIIGIVIKKGANPISAITHSNSN